MGSEIGCGNRREKVGLSARRGRGVKEKIVSLSWQRSESNALAMVQQGSERDRDEVCGGQKRTEVSKPQSIMCGDFVFGACAPKTVVLPPPN